MVRCHLKARLGNVLFEIASCYAYALDHGQEFTVSNTTKDPVWQPLYFQNLVNPMWDERKPAKWVREMQHNYQPLPWQDDWANYNIEMMGFWQSEKYFKHRRQGVLKLFNLPYEDRNCVSIHVRRGDYLTIPGKHIVFNDEYFDKAFAYFHDKGYDEFVVFTDDAAWCRDKFSDIAPEIISTDDPLADLVKMSHCRHHINSSSTYSWWGAWLTQHPESTVVTPREWFQSTQPEDTKDIIPDTWIKI
jgi:hypothetical protein